MNLNERTIAVIGLGYVGLPLAVAFGKKHSTVGFDIDVGRITELRACFDRTDEVSTDDLAAATCLTLSHDTCDLNECGVYVVTVPTPIDIYRNPDLRPLESASRTVGEVLSRGDVVIYESTVYPGATEEICVPILEEISGMRFNEDFFVGYSPERINPGDRAHRLETIVKVTSGSSFEAGLAIDALYQEIVSAGTHLAPSIKVAEAAKVIENTQRDVNIALINELALIFNRMGIDTSDVLAAAGSKWNFLPFRPGLVGGHCIGVDPYYLTHKAQSLDLFPEMILAGRRINDSMGAYISNQLIRLMLSRVLPVAGSNVLVMGFSFKANCPDIRNTKVLDVVRSLEEFHCKVTVWDPRCDQAAAFREYGIIVAPEIPEGIKFQAALLAVPHDEFRLFGSSGIRALLDSNGVIYDAHSVYPREDVDGRL